MIDLMKLREEIDDVDHQIVELYERRMKIAEDVVAYKLSAGKAVLDKDREKQKIDTLTKLASSEFNSHGVESVFNNIMAISRMRQYGMLAKRAEDENDFLAIQGLEKDGTTKVVFQGVEGAYAHQALEGYFGPKVDSFHVETWRDAMEVIKNGKARYGVLPIENSTAGIVNDVYDLLEEYNNYIVGEYIVKVEHALLVLPEASASDLKTVYSHPQALMQCAGYLDGHREWEQISLKNTAVSAKKVKEEGDPTQAAIASEQAARIFGLKVLKHHINDEDGNSTRFIIVSNKKEYIESADKISICFELPHTSGTLYNILGHFIFNNLNMTKIESRPIKGKNWQYRFFIDFAGNLDWQEVKNALKGIESETENFRILGNYIDAEGK